jgi:hypothetical protein
VITVYVQDMNALRRFPDTSVRYFHPCYSASLDFLSGKCFSIDTRNSLHDHEQKPIGSDPFAKKLEDKAVQDLKKLSEDENVDGGDWVDVRSCSLNHEE